MNRPQIAKGSYFKQENLHWPIPPIGHDPFCPAILLQAHIPYLRDFNTRLFFNENRHSKIPVHYNCNQTSKASKPKLPTQAETKKLHEQWPATLWSISAQHFYLPNRSGAVRRKSYASSASIIMEKKRWHHYKGEDNPTGDGSASLKRWGVPNSLDGTRVWPTEKSHLPNWQWVAHNVAIVSVVRIQI